MRRRDRLLRIYDTLLGHFGPLHWWPGKTPFEVMVGAVLTQNTSWSNVELAIANLKAAKRLGPHAVLELSHEELAELIRPSGYFNVKARRLCSLVRWYVEVCDCGIENLRRMPLAAARKSLLEVNGVGPETADSILLYAADHLTFVVDAYTMRIFYRLGVIGKDADYETVRKLFMRRLPVDRDLYNECHALIVNLGKDFCKPRPKCESCPLRQERHRCKLTNLSDKGMG